jgi:predicted dehydrogenase
MDSRKRLKLGVVGVGHLGQHHARIYAQMPGVELVGVVDINERRAKEVGLKLKVPYYTEASALYGKVKAVNIAVPTISHYSLAEGFLERKIDVLIEKPIASNPEEAEDLIQTASSNGCILQIGHVERFNNGFKVLQGLVRDPKFIECHRLGSFVERGTDVDVVLDLMIHDIDIVLSLERSPLKDLSAVGIRVLSQHVDIANARLQFESGCVANITASRVSMEKMRGIRIFQEDAYLALNYATQEISSYKREKSDRLSPYGLPYIGKEEIRVEKGEPLQNELESFIDCVRRRGTPLISGEEGRKALIVACQIKERF